MAEVEVGIVKKFFAKPSVAAIEVKGEGIKVGDMLHFKGHTTDFSQQVASMQEENKAIDKAAPGQLVGVQVKERVRENDIVYKVID
ncbi:MAG: translation elongation factor-like protein [Deltaproteobacteria bacterium]|nr:translation elongation factor-like protein [Deltaproteobacteria bacterium]MBW2070349.1 translation elongation factor-like protein [Deltaproteobacteria bacterium]